MERYEVSELLECALRHIDWHIGIKYWNENQEELESPFQNTGNKYIGSNFTVRAFDWSEPDEYLPNFEYKDIKIWWYKYIGRGMYANKEVTPDMVNDMINDILSGLTQEEVE